jgi:hypothetical protein
MSECTIEAKIGFSDSIIAHGSIIDHSTMPKKNQFLLGKRSHLKL